MHQLTKIAVILILLFMPCMASAGDYYCSLIVRVLSPDGSRIEAPVSVEQMGGHVVEKDPTFEDVKFCDLGILPVTVKVGNPNQCNEVVVKNVPLEWHQQRLLTVTYDQEHCLRNETPAPICRVLFRISGANNVWLDKAFIHFEDRKFSPTLTDDLGRALVVLAYGNRLTGNVGAEGYVQRPFSVACSWRAPIQEVAIKLERSRGR